MHGEGWFFSLEVGSFAPHFQIPTPHSMHSGGSSNEEGGGSMGVKEGFSALFAFSAVKDLGL